MMSFANQDALAKWTIRTPATDTLTLADRFVTSGSRSLRFTTPAYKPPMEQWPAFEAAPDVRDWTPFDRLVIDITNPHDHVAPFQIFISDSKVPFRQGLSFVFNEFPRQDTKRYVIPLETFPQTVDRSDISIIHFFSTTPKGPMEIYVSGFQLLKPGEEASPYPAAFVNDITEILKLKYTAFAERIDGQLKALPAKGAHPSPENYGKKLARIQNAVKEPLKILSAPLENLDALKSVVVDMESIERELQEIRRYFAFKGDCEAAGFRNPDMLAGIASSMVKVMPKHVAFDATPMRTVNLSLARHEWESFQMVVMGNGKGLENVSVVIEDLHSAEGYVFPAARIQSQIVGYVQTKACPPYLPEYIGWWPDPILNFQKSCAVAEYDAQSFWIRAYASRDQQPGLYTGRLTLQADGAEPIHFNLHVKVRDFTLPANTSLPTAIHTSWPKQAGAGTPKWDALKYEYADFLADYQIDYDQLYRQGPPDWDIVRYLHEQGRLTCFNLFNIFNGGISEKDFDGEMARAIDKIRPIYEKAKELGLLEHAYIYGFDERGGDQFQILERCAKALHEAFPEVLLMTTSYDHSYGMDSVVKSINAWCPLTPVFDTTRAGAARETGRYVWWYICCGPHNPYANWFVEYAAIESRLLMGAMTAKYRPDGFLYYFTNLWNDNKGIESGPYTNWNPVSWTVYHGDGSLFHCDKDGRPLPSIRLENYRDGMEDYAYACILEEAIRQYEEREILTKADSAWLYKARKALDVPDSLVKNMAEYSHSPAALSAWREAMADAIEESGLHDLNPWSKGTYGVRGMRN